MTLTRFAVRCCRSAVLARAAATNKRAQHYAMAAYYARVAGAKEKFAKTAEIMMSNDASNRR